MKSELRRVKGPEGGEHPLLHVALGLLSTFERFDRALEAHAPAGDEREPIASEAVGIDALLGIIAFRERLRATVARVPVPSDTPPLESLSSEPFTNELLR